MTTEEELIFLKKWIACLSLISPDIRQPTNAITIMFTGKYVSIDVRGQVEVSEVEGFKK